MRGRKKKVIESVENPVEDIGIPATVPEESVPVDDKPKIASIEQLFGNGDLNVVAAKLNEVIKKVNE